MFSDLIVARSVSKRTALEVDPVNEWQIETSMLMCMGRFDHCVVPAEQVFRSLHKGASSRTVLYNIVMHPNTEGSCLMLLLGPGNKSH